jgi:hypothetical protein
MIVKRISAPLATLESNRHFSVLTSHATSPLSAEIMRFLPDCIALLAIDSLAAAAAGIHIGLCFAATGAARLREDR